MLKAAKAPRVPAQLIAAPARDQLAYGFQPTPQKDSRMEKLLTEVAMYSNRRIALQLVTEDGEPWTMLSVNLLDVALEADEFCVPAWQLSAEELQLHLATGRFEDTGKIEAAGRLHALVWRVIDPQLLKAIAALQAGS